MAPKDFIFSLSIPLFFHFFLRTRSCTARANAAATAWKAASFLGKATSENDAAAVAEVAVGCMSSLRFNDTAELRLFQIVFGVILSAHSRRVKASSSTGFDNHPWSGGGGGDGRQRAAGSVVVASSARTGEGGAEAPAPPLPPSPAPPAPAPPAPPPRPSILPHDLL